MEHRSGRQERRELSLKVLMAALLVESVILSAPQGHERDTKSEPEKNLVIETLMSNATAFERGDLAALNRLWADDESVVVFENGHANYGWVDYRDHHLAPELAEMKNVSYRLTRIQPHLRGRLAWATFDYTFSADLADRHVEGGGVGTAVLEKTRAGWRIVHWHTSSPREPAAAEAGHKSP